MEARKSMKSSYSEGVREQIFGEVQRYCLSKGYVEGQGINNLVPHDCVAAFQMAKLLTERGLFDNYIAVAPEGLIYSFFFELLGAEVLSLFVDYPPTLVKEVDDFSLILGKRVLLIEDDVISGTTLRIVLDALDRYSPKSISLFLGHTKSVQHLDNIPNRISSTYIAEDYLLPALSQQYVLELETCWKNKHKSKNIE
jgi:hypothetical protein